MRKYLPALLLCSLILALSCGTAKAQECSPDTGDGPVQTGWAAVKKTTDSVTVSWVAPEFLTDCTPIAADPSLAITSYQFYASLDAPAQAALGAFEVPATQTSVDLVIANVDGVRPSSELYFAVVACNQFGCSSLSTQVVVKVGGPPGKALAIAVN